MSGSAIMSATGRQDWETPPALFKAISQELGPFTLDAAATPETTKVPGSFITPEMDAFQHTWRGQVWLNPPFGRGIGSWMERAADQARDHWGTHVAVLCPARTDAEWWHQHVLGRATEVYQLRGRVRFVGADHGFPFPLALVLYCGDEPTIPDLRTFDARGLS